MFVAGQPAWHKMGVNVRDRLKAAEAIEAAHLQWKAIFQTLSVNGKEIDRKLWQAVCRDDNGALLGVVQGRYNIIQNADCFDFLDSLVADGALRYESAGALGNGETVWLLAKYDGDLEIAGDKHEQYLLLVTSHDGSRCLECFWTSVRVVCQNTLNLALSGRKQSVKIRHCAEWKSKRDEAQRILGLTQDYFGDMREQLARLQDRAMTQEDMAAFTKLLYPSAGEPEGKPVATRTSNMRWGTERLFNRPEAGTHGATAWDSLNAVTDYADHYSTLRGSTTRLESALLGSAADLKQRAFDLLTGEDLMKQLLEVRAWKPVPQAVAPGSSSDDFNRLLQA